MELVKLEMKDSRYWRHAWDNFLRQYTYRDQKTGNYVETLLVYDELVNDTSNVPYILVEDPKEIFKVDVSGTEPSQQWIKGIHGSVVLWNVINQKITHLKTIILIPKVEMIPNPSPAPAIGVEWTKVTPEGKIRTGTQEVKKWEIEWEEVGGNKVLKSGYRILVDVNGKCSVKDKNGNSPGDWRGANSLSFDGIPPLNRIGVKELTVTSDSYFRKAENVGGVQGKTQWIYFGEFPSDVWEETTIYAKDGQNGWNEKIPKVTTDHYQDYFDGIVSSSPESTAFRICLSRNHFRFGPNVPTFVPGQYITLKDKIESTTHKMGAYVWKTPIVNMGTASSPEVIFNIPHANSGKINRNSCCARYFYEVIYAFMSCHFYDMAKDRGIGPSNFRWAINPYDGDTRSAVRKPIPIPPPPTPPEFIEVRFTQPNKGSLTVYCKIGNGGYSSISSGHEIPNDGSVTIKAQYNEGSSHVLSGWTGAASYYSNVMDEGNPVIEFTIPADRWETYIEFTAIGKEVRFINNLTDLISLRNEVNGGNKLADYYYKQTADINLGTSGINWVPIGNNPNNSSSGMVSPNIETKLKIFSGTYDGQGYTISGLVYNKGNDKLVKESNILGLFGSVWYGTLKNIVIKDFELDGTNSISWMYNVGTLAGSVVSSTVTDCMSLNVKFYASGKDAYGPRWDVISFGGLIGTQTSQLGSKSTVIRRCIVTGSIRDFEVRDSNVTGGLVGSGAYLNNSAQGNSTIENCYVQLDFANGICYDEARNVGGILGANLFKDTGYQTRVRNSVNISKISIKTNQTSGASREIGAIRATDVSNIWSGLDGSTNVRFSDIGTVVSNTRDSGASKSKDELKSDNYALANSEFKRDEYWRLQSNSLPVPKSVFDFNKNRNITFNIPVPSYLI